MGLLRASSMERSEPSLVPEWLKAAAGGGGGHSHPYGFPGNAHALPRHSSISGRAQYLLPQPVVNGASAERVLERENNQFRSYSNLGRGRLLERIERDREAQLVDRGRDWDWNRDRRLYDKERFKVSSTGFNDDRNRDRGLGFYRSPATRPDVERRLHPGITDNGVKKVACVPSGFRMTNGGDLFSNLHMGNIERNFPSRDAQDRIFVSTPNSGSLNRPLQKSDAARDGVDNRALPESHVDTEAIDTSDAASLLSRATAPKMSEGLVQYPSRMSPPPVGQGALENQRLEELALKQSRQLIPMKPSLPKTMGLLSRDKLKPKSLKASDTINSRTNQAAAAPYRSPAVSNLNKTAPGRLLVLKASKEAALSSAAVKPGNTGLSQTVPYHVPNGTSIPKQLVDRRAVPISRPRNGLPVHEERKPLVLGQNRSDFFNAIRKKAAANGENRNPQEKYVAMSAEADENKPRMEDNQRTGSPVKDISESLKDGKLVDTDGVTYGAQDGSCNQLPDKQFTTASFVGGSEEEETAFLKSLGWEESVEGAEEALTEEEINSFLQEHMRSLTSSPSILSRQNQKIRNALLDLNGGSLGSPSSSGSDSEDEPHVRRS